MSVAALAAFILSTGPARAAGVVGTGTSASCTEAAFNAAFAGGGTVTFNCGPAPVTITFTVPKVLTADTTIDGGGLITLSGGDSVGLFQTVNFDLTLDSLVLRDGNALDYGAVVNATNAAVTITDSTVMDNAVGAFGGAVAVIADGNQASLTITGSTFSGNSSGGHAGTIYALAACVVTPAQTTVSILNSTFAGNSAYLDGSVLFMDTSHVGPACAASAHAVVRYSTLSGNTAEDVLFLGLSATIDLAANVIGPNTSTVQCAYYGEIGSASLGHNVTDDSDCVNFVIAPIPPFPDLVVPITWLGPLASNSGPTQTMALQAGSPALNLIAPGAGDCGGAVNVDQRGISRPQGTKCDAGAFEAAVPAPTPIASVLPNANLPAQSSGNPLAAIALGLVSVAMLATLGVVRARRT